MAFYPHEYISVNVVRLKTPSFIDGIEDGRFMFWHEGGLSNETVSEIFEGNDMWYDKVPMDSMLQFNDKFGQVFLGQKVRLLMVIMNNSEFDAVKDVEISVRHSLGHHRQEK